MLEVKKGMGARRRLLVEDADRGRYLLTNGRDYLKRGSWGILYPGLEEKDRKGAFADQREVI